MPFIMIVEDNADACEPLAKYLEKAGHEVKCVPNGREALAHVLTKPPDVVLLDLLMPEMDGPSFPGGSAVVSEDSVAAGGGVDRAR